MEPDDDRRESCDATERRFEALVVALGREDRRFARRFSTPRAARLPAGAVALVAGLMATVLLGIVPLAIGLHLHANALVALGGIGLIVLPVLVPVLVRGALRRVRPLWT